MGLQSGTSHDAGNGNVGERKLVKPWRKPQGIQTKAKRTPILLCALPPREASLTLICAPLPGRRISLEEIEHSDQSMSAGKPSEFPE